MVKAQPGDDQSRDGEAGPSTRDWGRPRPNPRRAARNGDNGQPQPTPAGA